jgi:hypothetical protein
MLIYEGVLLNVKTLEPSGDWKTPKDAAPTEADAHAALRKLVARLRRRDLLGYYGWVLHRTQAGTLHYHGIAELPWFTDKLALWRTLVVASGFGPQQHLDWAKPEHGKYCARYVSTGLADLQPLRRAYSFSRDFPQVPAWVDPNDAVAAEVGMDPDPCAWVPGWLMRI